MRRRGQVKRYAFIALLFVACGGSTATSTTPGADAGAGTKDASSDAVVPTDGGTGLYPDGTTTIVVNQKGGFTGPGADGSTCTMVDATYTLVLPARDLSWKVCDSNDGGPYAFVTGQKTIAEADFGPLDTALHALKRTTTKQCGADKPSEEIVFTAPSGDVTYYDDFYFCDANDGKTYVSGIDEILAELGKLAR
jgi:hypothetical protein